MKNKRKFIYQYFSNHYCHSAKDSALSWYWEPDKVRTGNWIYSVDNAVPFRSSKKKYYCKPLNKYFSASQFVKHIHRMNKLKVFW